MPIPKKLHVIWVGDERKRPDRWIRTWRENHPAWEFKVWGNAEYDAGPWRCQSQLDAFRKGRAWEGVADVMRYEILHRYGGVYVDADSESLRPLDESLLDHRMFAVWESEVHAPGRVANGFIGTVPGHPVLGEMIARIAEMQDPLYRWPWTILRVRTIRPWKTVGPTLFTEVLGRHPEEATILPSALFLPTHHLDKKERPVGQSYARHHWGSTFNRYQRR